MRRALDDRQRELDIREEELNRREQILMSPVGSPLRTTNLDRVSQPSLDNVIISPILVPSVSASISDITRNNLTAVYNEFLPDSPSISPLETSNVFSVAEISISNLSSMTSNEFIFSVPLCPLPSSAGVVFDQQLANQLGEMLALSRVLNPAYLYPIIYDANQHGYIADGGNDVYDRGNFYKMNSCTITRYSDDFSLQDVCGQLYVMALRPNFAMLITRATLLPVTWMIYGNLGADGGCVCKFHFIFSNSVIVIFVFISGNLTTAQYANNQIWGFRKSLTGAGVRPGIHHLW
jgi:hypothetical protein